MKTRIFFLALAISSASLSTLAQNTCASDELNDQLLDSNPLFSRSFMYLEQAIAAQMALDPAERTDDVYVIPVVVHVIHEGEAVGTGSNISDEQVFSAITALNEDFRHLPGTNGDGDGVDVGIEFCLAARDPDGEPTTGIVRVDGSVVSPYADEGIEATGTTGASEEEVKALSTWPREEYMNIWIVNEIEDNNALGGIQGYAYFPINNPIDGIVVLHNAFGTVGNLKTNTDMNRTLTHEVGHYFGLYHTFHLTDDCDAEANCTTAGDRVCDTPVTPLNGSCSNPECSGTQQVENYMDYTPETCKNMFTEGQKVRIRTTLENDRTSLLTSLGCEPVTDFDCGISAIVSPSGSSCDAAIVPVVTLTNYGSIALTSCTINYNIDGIGNNSTTWNGNLASGTSTDVILPLIVSSSGTHTFYSWTINPNGLADENTANNQASQPYTISTGATATLIVDLDYFGTENTWEITDASNDIAAEGGPYVNNQQGLEIEENICIPSGCYTLTFFDSYGDGQGFTSGSFTLLDSEGNILAYEEDNWGEEVSNDFCIEAIIPDGEAPVASFSLNDNTVCPSGQVNFTDMSANAPTAWSWTFEGGSPATSNLQHPQNISFASVGTYDITLVATNEFGSGTYVCMNCVTVNTLPNVVLAETHPTCFGSANGSVAASVTGNSPFTYSWNSGQNTQNISGVPAGIYTLTTTDANGCVRVKSKTLTNPADILASANITNVTCNGLNDGFIFTEAWGGTGALNYIWSNGATGQQLNNLAPGSYSVSISDVNACSEIQTYTITQPAALVAAVYDFDIACSDEFGSATVAPAGGTSPYNIEWSNGSTGNSVLNLAAGNYSVAVTDANDCAVESNFIITQSANLSVFASVQDISCAGETDGSAEVNVSGGTGVYTFQWSNGSTAAALQNLEPGNYSVTVTDSENCSGTDEFIVAEPQAINLTIFKTDISCNGLADGTATATASGGTGNFSYYWSNGQQTNIASNLAQGVYMLAVQDENGCSENENISINEPSLLVANCELVSGESCSGSDGEATVNIMGGTPGYSAQWSNGVVSNSISEVSAGIYNVVVSDGNGCTTMQSVEIPFDCELDLPVTQVIETDCNQEDYNLGASISCTAVNGAEMYKWKFTTSTGDLIAEEVTLQNAISLFMVEELTWGLTAFVSVRILYNGSWGPYGEACLIGISDEVPTTQILEEDCGVTGIHLGYVINCSAVQDAEIYEWHITGPGYEWTPFTLINEIELTGTMMFEAFTTYNVESRVRINFVWGEWSESCSFTFAELTDVESFLHTGNFINVFPNPCDGQKIIFDLRNLDAGSPVQNLEIFGSSGSLIETIDLSAMPRGMRTEYKFKHPLPSGLYFIRYTLIGKTIEEKLVVR